MKLLYLILGGKNKQTKKSTQKNPFHSFQLYLSKFLPAKLIYFSQKHYFKMHILNTNTNLLDFQPNKSSVRCHQSQHQHHFELLLLEP